MVVDWPKVVENLIVFFIGSAGTWVFTSVFKLRRDMNSAFSKLRHLENKIKED